MEKAADNIHFLVEEIETKANKEIESALYELQHPRAVREIGKLFEFTRAMILAYHDLSHKGSSEHQHAVIREQALLTKLDRLRQLRERRASLKPREVKEEKKPQIQIEKKGVVQHVSLAIDRVTQAELAYATFDEKEYVVHEPSLSEEAGRFLTGLHEYREKLKKILLKQDHDALKRFLMNMARKMRLPYSPESFEPLRYYLIRNYFRFGPIDPLMNDEHVTQIMCSGVHQRVEIVRNSVRLQTSVVFQGKEQLNSLVKRIARRAGQKLTVEDPVVDATVKDFRVQATLGTDYAQPRFTFTRITKSYP